MSMITEQVERLRTLADIAKDIADNSTDTVKTLREAADTIEAYQKAFEDIRTEIETIIGEHNLDDYDFCSGLICARKIIDKHNPDKVGKERDKE